MNSRILLVEDEENLREAIKLNLELEGYEVEEADTGTKALKKTEEQRFNLIILDVMLPEMDGFTVCQKMRMNDTDTPVIFLTAKDTGQDKVNGFKHGGDDYLTKPFDLSILIARIQGLLRRREWMRDAALAPPPKPPERTDAFVFGDKAVYFNLLELRVREQVFPLTLMEMNLLRYLVEHEGRPVSRKAMLEEVWGLHEDTDTRAIDNFIVRLRRYIEDEPATPRHLQTVRGVGYRFVAFPAPA